MKFADIGMIGLGVMGESLALNIESRGYTVAGYNLPIEKVDAFIAKRCQGKNIIGCHSITELCDSLAKPRKIMLMVNAGAPVDAVINELIPCLDQGDIIIDGGNSHFPDTIRRTKDLEAKGLLFIGTGVSGGEEGALKGPSIMPGGSPKAWPFVKEIFQAISAKAPDGTPCCEWVGNDGAGHFVKMVHNGIEYGDMQLICEAYQLMRYALDMTPKEIHKIFSKWNQGVLDSYLIEITADILAKEDAESGLPMVDLILDTAGQKGTGKWTSTSALDLGVPAPTIAEAVFARCVSAIKEERIIASEEFAAPTTCFKGDKEAFIAALHDALYASKICSYAQGMALLTEAGKEYKWQLNFGDISMLWREGCIIRAQFLSHIKDAYTSNPELTNLLLDPYFKDSVTKAQDNWRKVVMEATRLGIPMPAFSSALAYFDSYRTARLPANLLQAQRDYFGAHTYERVDKARGEFFHTQWI